MNQHRARRNYSALPAFQKWSSKEGGEGRVDQWEYSESEEDILMACGYQSTLNKGHNTSCVHMLSD
jgi:hypothetical protein